MWLILGTKLSGLACTSNQPNGWRCIPFQGHNIVLYSNHQTEADPAVIALLLESSHPFLSQRVVSDAKVCWPPRLKAFFPVVLITKYASHVTADICRRRQGCNRPVLQAVQHGKVCQTESCEPFPV